MDKKVLSNSAWMSLEKVVSIFGLIFVTSFVAKYIGPGNFGKLSFVGAIFMAVQTVAMLGSEHVLAKRISRNWKSGIRLMMSSSYMRSFIFILFSGPVLFWLYRYSDGLTFIFGLSTAVAYYFLAADVYSVYNDARLNSSINAIYNITGLFVGFFSRWLIAEFRFSVHWLVIPIVLSTFIPFILKRIHFHKGVTFPINKQNGFKYSKYLFITGLPLAISSTSIIIYAKISQLFLMKFQGSSQLGIYSVATTLGTAWTFITSALVTSAFARVYATKSREQAIRMAAQLNTWVFFVGLIFIMGLLILGRPLIYFLYGNAYSAAYPVMMIMAFNSFFSCMGPVANKFIIYESGYSYISKKMISMLFIVVPTAYLLTKFYGMYGAAWSAVIGEFMSLTVLNYFFKRGVIAKIHLRSFLPFKNRIN